MTKKTRHFLEFVRENPGLNALRIHRAIGHLYTRNGHQFTYATLKRMVKNGLATRGPSANGRGFGIHPVG